MKRRCRHRKYMHYGWHSVDGYWYESPYLARHQADATICLDCGAWLSLGPSRDDSEQVAIEMRAFEIAVNVAEFTEWWLIYNCRTDERHGWRDHEGKDRGGDCTCSTSSGHVARNWHAGYLARAIASHDSSQGGG